MEQKKNGYPAGYRLRLDTLRKKALKKVGSLEAAVAVTREPAPPEEKEMLVYKPVRPGEIWARHVYDCGWFHMTGTLPENAQTRDLYLRLNVGGEGLVYASDGAPYEMISAKMNPVDALTAERGKTLVPLSDAVTQDGHIDFYMDAGFNGTVFSAPFGVGVFRYAQIVEKDPAYYGFYYDWLTVLSLYSALPEGDGADVRQALETAFHMAEKGDPELGRTVLEPVLTAGSTDFTLYAVGHSHLDLAWLWPIRETKRKSARTFTKQLNNIDRVPAVAVRVPEGAPARRLEKDRSGGQSRRDRAAGRDVRRSRHEPLRRGGADPSTVLRQNLFPGDLRAGYGDLLAAGRFRLQRQSAADPEGRGDPLFLYN